MENEKWHLISSTGVAPKQLYYIYKKRGVKYELEANVHYDKKGNPHPFGKLRLTVNNKKTYYFDSYQELATFLIKRNIPLTGVEDIVRLWFKL